MPSGSSPNSRANLRPIQPGEIRNPRGMTVQQRANIKKAGEKAAAMMVLAMESLEIVVTRMREQGQDEAVIAAVINTATAGFIRDGS